MCAPGQRESCSSSKSRWVNSSQRATVLARVSDPRYLKAELRIAETQAKDITFGQRAEIDTRNGVIPGTVTRIDPAAEEGTVTVDVRLDGELPKGARPDLSVDGRIILDHLVAVVKVGRPVYRAARRDHLAVPRGARRGTCLARAGFRGPHFRERNPDPAGIAARRPGHFVGHVGDGRIRPRSIGLELLRTEGKST